MATYQEQETADEHEHRKRRHLRHDVRHIHSLSETAEIRISADRRLAIANDIAGVSDEKGIRQQPPARVVHFLRKIHIQVENPDTGNIGERPRADQRIAIEPVVASDM